MSDAFIETTKMGLNRSPFGQAQSLIWSKLGVPKNVRYLYNIMLSSVRQSHLSFSTVSKLSKMALVQETVQQNRNVDLHFTRDVLETFS